MKIICAGYPKTGTKSLHSALKILGYNNIFDYFDHFDHFFEDFEKFFAKKIALSEILDKYEAKGVECTIDMPPSFLFEDFHKRWPKAKVILTVREEESWFVSIKKMNDAVVQNYFWMSYFSQMAYRYNAFMRQLYQFMLGDKFERKWLWKSHYRKHNLYVQKVIPKESLLVFDLKKGWEPLCEFLGKEIPDVPFPVVNVAGEKGNMVERLIVEPILAKTAKVEIIFTFSLILIGSIVLTYLYFSYIHESLF